SYHTFFTSNTITHTAHTSHCQRTYYPPLDQRNRVHNYTTHHQRITPPLLTHHPPGKLGEPGDGHHQHQRHGGEHPGGVAGVDLRVEDDGGLSRRGRRRCGGRSGRYGCGKWISPGQGHRQRQQNEQ